MPAASGAIFTRRLQACNERIITASLGKIQNRNARRPLNWGLRRTLLIQSTVLARLDEKQSDEPIYMTASRLKESRNTRVEDDGDAFAGDNDDEFETSPAPAHVKRRGSGGMCSEDAAWNSGAVADAVVPSDDEDDDSCVGPQADGMWVEGGSDGRKNGSDSAGRLACDWMVVSDAEAATAAAAAALECAEVAAAVAQVAAGAAPASPAAGDDDVFSIGSFFEAAKAGSRRPPTPAASPEERAAAESTRPKEQQQQQQQQQSLPHKKRTREEEASEVASTSPAPLKRRLLSVHHAATAAAKVAAAARAVAFQ